MEKIADDFGGVYYDLPVAITHDEKGNDVGGLISMDKSTSCFSKYPNDIIDECKPWETYTVYVSKWDKSAGKRVYPAYTVYNRMTHAERLAVGVATPLVTRKEDVSDEEMISALIAMQRRTA